MATTINLVLVAFLAFIKGISSGSTCVNSYAYGSYTTYCAGDCCRYNNYRYCCNGSSIVWIIVGSVVGGIVFIGVLVTICICIVCKCTKKGGHVGSVVTPAGQATNIAVVSNTTTHRGTYSQQGFQQQPSTLFVTQQMPVQTYPQPMPVVQPPPYSSSHDQAYPPPPVSYPPPIAEPESQQPQVAYPTPSDASGSQPATVSNTPPSGPSESEPPPVVFSTASDAPGSRPPRATKQAF